MKYSNRLVGKWVAASILLVTATFAAAQDINVYKRASCGCCGKWIEHLRANGFTPQVHEMQELDPIKQKLGIPQQLRTCHTAQIGGYAIEGHVPADLIRKLLKERPDAIGLAVPSMPPGSPGMEGPSKIDYAVLLIKRDGSFSTYANR